jgi:hypothetical protein
MKKIGWLLVALLVVTLLAELCGPDRSALAQVKLRNPFGVADNDDPPDDKEVMQFADKVKLNTTDKDANAVQWAQQETAGKADSIEGTWSGRWNGGPAGNWITGEASIKIAGGRVYILYKDQTNTYLAEVIRTQNNKLIGRWQNIGVRGDKGMFVGAVVNGERIDGVWGETGARWDFRRKLAKPKVKAKQKAQAEVMLGAEDYSLCSFEEVQGEKTRNPFGVEDNDDPPDDDAVKEFGKTAFQKLPGGDKDSNAEQWAPEVTPGKAGSLEGKWYSRWKGGPANDWIIGEATIKQAGKRLYILYKDKTNNYLAEVVRDKDQLLGRWQNLGVRADKGFFAAKIVNNERLDGTWGGDDRWDFRRKLAKEKLATRNPFGVPDVEGAVDDDEVKKFAKDAKLPGDDQDKNAEQWAEKETTGTPGSLDGTWYGRWGGGQSTAEIKTVKDRVYILYTEPTATWLIEAVRVDKKRLEGRWRNVKADDDKGLFAGLIVNNERIDGAWGDGTSRWDFRRKLAKTGAKKRNPFGLPDVKDPNGEDVKEFAKTVQLSGDDKDPNAKQWVPKASKGKANSIEGDWYGRWGAGDGSAEIKIIKDRVYVFYKEANGTWLIDAALVDGKRLVGRYQGYIDGKVNESDAGPFVGLVVNNERIDGVWGTGTSRWDFRRKFE